MKRALLVLLLVCGELHAAEFERIDVSLDDDVYRVEAIADVDAGIKAVRGVITDYNHMHWITGAVLEARTLERPAPDIAVVYVRTRACFGIFCKTIEQVQTADTRLPDHVIFESIPERSDVRQGHSEWQLTAVDSSRTRLTWRMRMEPDFWVPFMIGPRMIRSGLEDEGRDMIRGIEKLAREREQR